MDDRAAELLNQYDIEVKRTRKGRGAILCDTEQGCLILKEYTGNEERAGLQNRLLEKIAECGLVNAESLLLSKEGTYLVKDAEGTSYLLKTWKEGRECSIYDRVECAGAVKLLAKLHDCMELPADTPGIPVFYSPENEYEKHNREMRKVRKYLKQKGQKQSFELSLLGVIDFFIQRAEEVTADWKQYSSIRDSLPERMTSGGMVPFCHGDYQYHNILLGSDGWFVVNFDKFIPDDPVRDLYLLMRKLLEKGDWSVELGQSLIDAYQKERRIAAGSWIDLYYRLAYPEKFWKIANFYYNSPKAWIPEKNREKLEKLIMQEQQKQQFLDHVFRDLSRIR